MCGFPSLCTHISGLPALVVLLEQGGWTSQPPEASPNLHRSVVSGGLAQIAVLAWGPSFFGFCFSPFI